MTRVLPLLLLAFTTGCFPTHRHSLADVIKAPPASRCGTLVVVGPEGTRTAFEAPYEVQPFPGGLAVNAKLLPSVEFEAKEVTRLETTQFSIGGTVLLVAGAAHLAVIAAIVGIVAQPGFSIIRFPAGFF